MEGKVIKPTEMKVRKFYRSTDPDDSLTYFVVERDVEKGGVWALERFPTVEDPTPPQFLVAENKWPDVTVITDVRAPTRQEINEHRRLEKKRRRLAAEKATPEPEPEKKGIMVGRASQESAPTGMSNYPEQLAEWKKTAPSSAVINDADGNPIGVLRQSDSKSDWVLIPYGTE